MFRASKNICIQSTPILIEKVISNIPINPSMSSPTNYSLKKNCFDPSKNSPPNEFMKKLNDRMNTFN